MENPFKSIKPKDWLYIGGAVASLVALAWIFGQQTSIGTGTQTDTPNPATLPVSPMPGYTTYNFPPQNPTPLATSAPEETPAGSCGCGSPSSYGCAGPSQLDNGGAYTSNSQLYSFLESINPQYAALQAQQLNTYAEYFAAGQQYSTGAGTVAGVL